jgi:hypothetical protein
MEICAVCNKEISSEEAKHIQKPSQGYQGFYEKYGFQVIGSEMRQSL